MIVNRADIVYRNFLAFLDAWNTREVGSRRSLDEPAAPGSDDGRAPTRRVLMELFESQMTARLLDLASREMRARDESFYTIGSLGHEGNVVLGRLARHTDPAFLHYRSCALMVERARHVAGIDPVRDILLSYTAAAQEPIAGGRHKVFGSRPLWVPPQTSTIASHLPKSVGAAIAIGRARKLRLALPIPPDSIVLCSFGDASLNHSVSQGAFNTASWTAYQNVPVPVLFVCEDNGIGISVHTPAGWVEESVRQRPGFRYFYADGLDLVHAYRVAAEAIEYCRSARMPTFLHLRTVRLLGHAGSDVETEYHSVAEIEAVEARDPLIATARIILEGGFATAAQIHVLYESIAERIRAMGRDVARLPKLTSAQQILAPLAPYHPDKVNAEATCAAPHEQRIATFGSEALLPEKRGPRHFAVLQNWGLHDALAKYPESVIFGEDVAQKGGVYHVTTGLYKKFGPARVFNTLLDETSILGLAIGAAHLGFLPIPELQYLAYYHNAEDQIRGEACSLQFFSNAQFANPMVVRIASMAYQKGFGGHFHNDNSIGALRDIPGLVIALPSRGDDAVCMMRTCLALAKVDGRVVAFLEPIALYMTKDLHAADDKGWLFEYPPPHQAIPLGQGRVYRHQPASPAATNSKSRTNDPPAEDLTIITFGNGVYMSLRAARKLHEQFGIRARIVDIRWLSPLNIEFILEQARVTGRMLVVDECRYSGGGVAEAIMAAAAESTPAGHAPLSMARVTAMDTYIPLGPAANLVLPQEDQIVQAAFRMTGATREPNRPPRSNGKAVPITKSPVKTQRGTRPGADRSGARRRTVRSRR